jgi:hypothetical protein
MVTRAKMVVLEGVSVAHPPSRRNEGTWGEPLGAIPMESMVGRSLGGIRRCCSCLEIREEWKLGGGQVPARGASMGHWAWREPANKLPELEHAPLCSACPRLSQRPYHGWDIPTIFAFTRAPSWRHARQMRRAIVAGESFSRAG